MTSWTASGQREIAQTGQFSAMFASLSLDNSSILFKKVCSFGKGDSWASSFCLWCIRHYCILTPKISLKKSTHYTNGWFRYSQKLLKLATYKLTSTGGAYNSTGNKVIGYFLLATNGVHPTGATANFSVRKYFLSIISENATTSN